MPNEFPMVAVNVAASVLVEFKKRAACPLFHSAVVIVGMRFTGLAKRECCRERRGSVKGCLKCFGFLASGAELC